MHSQGGATWGAEMTFREGISPSTQPDGRASSVSPRYEIWNRVSRYRGALSYFAPVW